jgi:hypothetical protein
MRIHLALALAVAAPLAHADIAACPDSEELVSRVEMASMAGQCMSSDHANTATCQSISAQLDAARAQRDAACAPARRRSTDDSFPDVAPARITAEAPSATRTSAPRDHKPRYCALMSRAALLAVLQERGAMTDDQAERLNRLLVEQTSSLPEVLFRDAVSTGVERGREAASSIPDEKSALERYRDKVEADCLLDR